MSESLHPDVDVLNAFVEGVLPAHERQQCLVHLADCARCRDVVFAAPDPQAAPPAEHRAPAWRRWFAPVPVLAAATCIGGMWISWYLLRSTDGPPAPDVIARGGQSKPVSAPPSPDNGKSTGVSAPATPSKVASGSAPLSVSAEKVFVGAPYGSSSVAASRSEISATTPTATLNLPLPPPVQLHAGVNQNQLPDLPPVLTRPVPASAGAFGANTIENRRLADDLSGISGTVADPTGAAIPSATVVLRELAHSVSSRTQTDPEGKFRLAGLPAGRYEMQVTSSGFKTEVRQIELHPHEMATVNPELGIGSVSEAVEVAAETPSIQTSASASSRGTRRKSPPAPHPLPSGLPSDTTVTSGRLLLAMDTAGALFFSSNEGKAWKAIKPVWPGKVVRLVTPADPSQSAAAVFQLTTDSGSVWLSRDGTRWNPAPAKQ